MIRNGRGSLPLTHPSCGLRHHTTCPAIGHERFQDFSQRRSVGGHFDLIPDDPRRGIPRQAAGIGQLVLISVVGVGHQDRGTSHGGNLRQR